MKILFFILISFLLTACNMEHDGKYVTDGQGNIYKLHHRIGDLYFVRNVDKDSIKRIIELEK